jgi:hypothetical protein
VPDSNDRMIEEMEVAEAHTEERERALAREHVRVVESFVRDYGVEALETALRAGRLFKGLRAESRWALETALSASATRAVDGYLLIKVPRMPNDLTEMTFLTGGVKLQVGFG